MRAANASNSANLALLWGLELGTSAPACASPTGGILPWVDGPVIDSPGHYGVYYTPNFIDDGIFDCSETGSNGYVGDTADLGGFGGINHPRNPDGGSRWHCWNTVQRNGVVEGAETSPILFGNQRCARGIDNYAAAAATDSSAFRSMEIISGDNLPQKTTLSRWDAMLQNRYRVAAVAGGDGHTAARKQDLGNAASCLYSQAPGESAAAYFACFIDKGGKVKGTSVGKIGGSGRTMVAVPKASLATAGVSDPSNPVRSAIKSGATIATNGPRVLARIGTVLPGSSANAPTGTVRLRVDWQADFKHAGDAKNWCTLAEKVRE